MLKIEKGNYVYQIKVTPDISPMDPRQDDNLGTMICSHRKYRLGDHEVNYHDCNNWAEVEIRYFAEKNGISNEDICEMTDIEKQEIQELIEENYIVLPLYLYDHSGITMNTTGFSCRWDSGIVGFIFCKKGAEDMTDEELVVCLKAEVKTYDHYLKNEVYGYWVSKTEKPKKCNCCNQLIQKLPEDEDSCWGYYGDSGITDIKNSIREIFPELSMEELENLELEF